MKKLSKYKEFFYRDRSLEEFLKDPIWSKIYRNIVRPWVARHELTLKEREAADFLIMSKKEAAAFLNGVYRCLIVWSNPYLMNIDEIEDEIDRLLGKIDPDDYDEWNPLLLNCIYAAYRLRDTSSPTPWQLDEAICIIKNRMDYNQAGDSGATMGLDEKRYLLDLAPHPDFEALERRNADWWNEVTDYFDQERIRTLARLYEVPEENLRMKKLVRKRYDEAPPRPGSDAKLHAYKIDHSWMYLYPEWERVKEEAVQADRIIVMNDGKIIQDGMPEDIFKQKENLKKIGLSVPLAVDIVDALQKKGLKLANVFDNENLAKELQQLICK